MTTRNTPGRDTPADSKPLDPKESSKPEKPEDYDDFEWEDKPETVEAQMIWVEDHFDLKVYARDGDWYQVNLDSYLKRLGSLQ